MTQINKDNLTVEQLAEYNHLIQSWGNMSLQEVLEEIQYYQTTGQHLPDDDPCKERFNRELASLQTYKSLFS